MIRRQFTSICIVMMVVACSPDIEPIDFTPYPDELAPMDGTMQAMNLTQTGEPEPGGGEATTVPMQSAQTDDAQPTGGQVNGVEPETAMPTAGNPDTSASPDPEPNPPEMDPGPMETGSAGSESSDGNQAMGGSPGPADSSMGPGETTGCGAAAPCAQGLACVDEICVQAPCPACTDDAPVCMQGCCQPGDGAPGTCTNPATFRVSQDSEDDGFPLEGRVRPGTGMAQVEGSCGGAFEEVFYLFEPQETRAYCIVEVDVAMDLGLYVQTSCCGSSEVDAGCMDNAGGEDSQLTLHATEGVRYLIGVDSWRRITSPASECPGDVPCDLDSRFRIEIDVGPCICATDAVCPAVHACEDSTCVNRRGQACETDEGCGKGGECTMPVDGSQPLCGGPPLTPGTPPGIDGRGGHPELAPTVAYGPQPTARGR